MAVGQSGRIVVDLDPELKRQLHERLRADGRDFKGWLLQRVQEYLDVRASAGAPQVSEEPPLDLSEVEERVLDAVSSDKATGHHADDLAEATGLGAGELHQALLQLELRGRVVHRLGFYRRARSS